MGKNFKKAVSLAMALALSASILGGCKSQKKDDAANQGNVKLWFAYNTENFMKDLEYPKLMEARDYTLRMDAIRNDVETVQLMVTPSTNILSFDFQVADLKNEKGDIFSKENLSVYAAWYVEVLESYMANAYYGYYPDALVPLDKLQAAQKDYIEAGQNQAIWLEASVPADQPAGVYEGNAELVVDGDKYSVPIVLTVYDAVMPEQNNLNTCFDIWYDYIALGEGYYSEELADAYYEFLKDKHLSPTKAIPSLWALGARYEAYVNWLAEEAAEDPEVSVYSLPYGIKLYELGSIVDEEGVIKLLTMMAEKNIELREAGNETIDLFKKAVYYLGGIVDEPSGDGLQRTRDCDLIIQKAKLAIADTYFKDKYPDLYESCIHLNHIVTTAYSEELTGTDEVGGVQTWCGQAQTWHTEEQRAEMEARRESEERTGGEDTWWYTCEQPRNPFVNFHLDDDLLNTRTICWMMHEYGVEGMIYWSITWFNSEDVWTTPVNYLQAVGDGMLCYPGSEFGVYGPISTLRLENLRESAEDYECLLLIEQAIIAYNQAKGTDYDPAELMEDLYEGLYEGAVPQRDNAVGFAQQRIEMLKILQQFTTDADGAIDTLLKG